MNPKLPLHVFYQGFTIEVLDANARPVIKWTGFEASDFGLQTQLRAADAVVAEFNKKHKKQVLAEKAKKARARKAPR